MKHLKIALSDGFEASASMKPLPEIEKDLAACLRVFMLFFPDASRKSLKVTRENDDEIVINNGVINRLRICDDGTILFREAYDDSPELGPSVFAIAELFLELGYWPAQ